MKEYRKYKPARFFLAAILITWIAWFGAAFLSYRQGVWSGRLFSMLELAGLFGPVIAAIWMISTSNDRDLRQNFYDRLLNIKLIKAATVPAIFLTMPLAVAVSVLISYAVFGQSLDQLKIVKAAPVGLIPAPVMFFGAALLEELGWKGYGMDSLRGRRTFFTATLIYSLLWALWHIPLFFINNYYHNTLIRTNPLYALNFMVSVIPAALIINWLWYKNRGSILTAVLFHAVANFQGILQMGQTAKCIETVVLIFIAAIVVIMNKDMFFGGFQSQVGYFGSAEARRDHPRQRPISSCHP